MLEKLYFPTKKERVQSKKKPQLVYFWKYKILLPTINVAYFGVRLGKRFQGNSFT